MSAKKKKKLLSQRVRARSEAAPWVIEEIVALEKQLAEKSEPHGDPTTEMTARDFREAYGLDGYLQEKLVELLDQAFNLGVEAERARIRTSVVMTMSDHGDPALAIQRLYAHFNDGARVTAQVFAPMLRKEKRKLSTLRKVMRSVADRLERGYSGDRTIGDAIQWLRTAAASRPVKDSKR